MESFQQIESVQKGEGSLENVTKEDLIMIVAEKVKEIKSLSMKNSKLQTKYIGVYKQHKQYKKDHSNLLEFLKLVFQGLPEKPLGAIEQGELQEMWAQRQAKVNEKFRGLLLQVNKEKERLEVTHKQQMEEVRKVYQSSIETLKEELGKQIVVTKNREQQLAQLRNQCSNKDQQIQKLNNLLSKLQSKLISPEEPTTKDQQQEKKHDEGYKDQVFTQMHEQNNQLTKDLEEALQKIEDFRDKIQQLEAQLTKRNKEFTILKQAVQAEKAKFVYKDQKTSKNGQHSQKYQNGSSKGVKKTKSNSHYQSEDKEYIQKEYLKNVFMRFMKCLNESNYPQAQTLENILMTILDFNSRERQISTLKPKAWWNIFE